MKQNSMDCVSNSLKSLVACHAYADNVLPIKSLEQGSRTARVQKVGDQFSPSTTVPSQDNDVSKGICAPATTAPDRQKKCAVTSWERAPDRSPDR